MRGTAGGTDGAFRYRAFISYRHADKAWGDWLHRALEAYRVPRDLVGTSGDAGPVPARLSPIFRDREELSASANLAREIDEALQGSAALVVICSPGAAQSRWVNEEVLRFKRLGRADRVFAIIVDGEPHATDPARECFPPALKFELTADGALSDRTAEPIAADAREAGDGRENAKLKLIAGLLGVDYDRLRQREAEAQRRRFRRFALIAAALVLVFAGLAGAAGWFAWQSEIQRSEAEAQRAEAEKQRNEAEASLTAGLDAARTLIFEVGAKAKNVEGAQQKVLVRIQQLAQTLLEKLAKGREGDPKIDYQRALSMLQVAEVDFVSGATFDAITQTRKAIWLLEAIVANDPSDDLQQVALCGAYNLLAELMLATNDSHGASQVLTGNRGRIEALAARHPGDGLYLEQQVRTLKLIGKVQFAQNDVLGACDSYEAGLAVGEKLAASDPDNEEYRVGLAEMEYLAGDARRMKHDNAVAMQRYMAGFAIYRDLAAGDASNTAYRFGMASGYVSIGDLKDALGDAKAARAAYDAALAIDAALGSESDRTEYLHHLSLVHARIARLQLAAGDAKGAAESADAARRTAELACQKDTTNTAYQSTLGRIDMLVGDVALGLKDGAAALAAFRAAFAIFDRLTSSDPSNGGHLEDAADAKEHIGRELLAEGKLEDALASFRAAVSYRVRVVQATPGINYPQYDLSLCLLQVGQVEEQMGDKAAAKSDYERALEIVEKLAASDPGNTEYAAGLTVLTAAIERVSKA